MRDMRAYKIYAMQLRFGNGMKRSWASGGDAGSVLARRGTGAGFGLPQWVLVAAVDSLDPLGSVGHVP